MTVRGPPGPPGSPGLGWLDSSFSPSGSCGCNESLLRLYVKDTNPKLIPGPIGPPGPAGPEGPSGLPVRIYSSPDFTKKIVRECLDHRAMKVHLGHQVPEVTGVM